MPLGWCGCGDRSTCAPSCSTEQIIGKLLSREIKFELEDAIGERRRAPSGRWCRRFTTQTCMRMICMRAFVLKVVSWRIDEGNEMRA